MTTHTQILSYRNLPETFYSDLEPSKFEQAKLLRLNSEHAQSLGLSETFLRSDAGVDILSGQAALNTGGALAMAYCGHQFGNWAGLLGDGRARLVGEVKAADGELRELHLKGAGQTPYSRRGDGRATLGSAIREYVVSEAMAALGVPTTRALSIITTGQYVRRSESEPGAIICRTAQSHIRVGTFQYAATTGDTENITALADFAIDRLYPYAPESGPERYGYFLRSVAERQADLVARWMGLGFIHGVMNTDNMCVSGETIDYGPCAFIDDFHPGKVFSSIDHYGRYAWNKQPEMAHWNLARLAECLLPLLGEDEDASIKAAEDAIGAFAGRFKAAFHGLLARKLGLTGRDVDMNTFSAHAFTAMSEGEVDFTRFFTTLTRLAAGGTEQELIDVFNTPEQAKRWIKTWKEATGFEGGLDDETVRLMQSTNPVIIPRNHRVEEVITAANAGDYAPLDRLIEATQSPFEARADFADYETAPEPDEVVERTFCGT